MNKLARLINTLDAKELALIQQDLQQGTLNKIVSQRLERIQAGPEKKCPVCLSTIHANNALNLEYGSTDLRRKAYFDATDCLQHFITHNLKNT